MEKQFEVSGSCFGGSWSDAERHFSEELEDLLRLQSSNMVLVNKFLNVLQAEVCGGMVIEEELKELAEKRVQRLVLRSQRDELRPTSCQKVSDLRTEGDVVFDKLVAGSQELAQGNDLWRRQLQALKAVSVGSERIGENEGVATVILGAAHGMAVPESVDLLGVDGENGDAALEKGFDHGPMRFFDRHRNALGIFARQVHEPVERCRQSVDAMLEASFL